MSCTPIDRRPPDPDAVLTWRGPRSLADVRSRSCGTVWWAVNTCWWTVQGEHLRRRKPDNPMDPGGLPCDPRGSVLMMSQDVDGFLSQAGANWAHYGPYGCTAFLAAYNGNVSWASRPSWPTSLRTWDLYGKLIDDWAADLAEILKLAETTLARRWDTTVRLRTEGGQVLWEGLRESSAEEKSEWGLLAHARSEWALKNLLVCAEDLARLRESIAGGRFEAEVDQRLHRLGRTPSLLTRLNPWPEAAC